MTTYPWSLLRLFVLLATTCCAPSLAAAPTGPADDEDLLLLLMPVIAHMHSGTAPAPVDPPIPGPTPVPTFPVQVGEHVYTRANAQPYLEVVEFIVAKPLSSEHNDRLLAALVQDFRTITAMLAADLPQAASLREQLDSITSPYYHDQVRRRLYEYFYFLDTSTSTSVALKVIRDVVLEQLPVIAVDRESKAVLFDLHVDLGIAIDALVRQVVNAPPRMYDRPALRAEARRNFEALPDKEAVNQTIALWHNARQFLLEASSQSQRNALVADMRQAYSAGGTVDDASLVFLRAGVTYYQALLNGLVQSNAALANSIQGFTNNALAGMAQVDASLAELNQHVQQEAEILPCTIDPRCTVRIIEF